MAGNLLEQLQPYFDDDDIGKIMINDYDTVFVQKSDGLIKTDLTFESEQVLQDLIHKTLDDQGIDVDQKDLIVDCRLSNGARMNIVFPPISTTGITITIHKHAMRQMRWEDLLRFGTMNESMSELLQACVRGKLNICIAGGANSGKSTLFNELATFIPQSERVIVLESASELDLRREHVVMLEATSSNDGATMTDLVINALKMAPDRLVMGEVQGAVIVDILQVMDIGINGMMFHINATSLENAFTRMLIMAKMHPLELPNPLLCQQIADGLDLIVMQMYLPDGKRRITEIAEVVGYDDGEFITETIFEYVEDTSGGRFRTTGYTPNLVQKLQSRGIQLPESMFQSE